LFFAGARSTGRMRDSSCLAPLIKKLWQKFSDGVRVDASLSLSQVFARSAFVSRLKNIYLYITCS